MSCPCETCAKKRAENEQLEKYAADMEVRLEHIRLLCRLGRSSAAEQNRMEMFDVIEAHARVKDPRRNWVF